MTLRVLALSWYHRDGASSRVRMMQYAPHLERLGVALEVAPLLPPDYIQRLYRSGRRPALAVAAACAGRLWTLLTRRDAEIVWVQREAIPFLPAVLERGLLAGRRVVVDYDDAHHLYYKNAHPMIGAVLGDKLERLMAAADAVTVGSPDMADVARSAGTSAVHLVPSAVDVARYRAEPDPCAPFAVGWIGSPMTADESLPLIQAPLKRFLADTGARCVLVGVRPDQFPNLPAERIPWSEAGEGAALAGISVGVCPLPDTPWHRGKSGYKIIQYMAAGKPALVSPVGIAATLADDGETGFRCATEDDWYRRLMELYRDAAGRAAMGARARAIAAERFDVAVVAAQLQSIFNDVLRNRP